MSLTAPVMTESVLMRSLSIEKQNRQLTPVERKGGGGRWRGRVGEREGGGEGKEGKIGRAHV